MGTLPADRALLVRRSPFSCAPLASKRPVIRVAGGTPPVLLSGNGRGRRRLHHDCCHGWQGGCREDDPCPSSSARPACRGWRRLRKHHWSGDCQRAGQGRQPKPPNQRVRHFWCVVASCAGWLTCAPRPEPVRVCCSSKARPAAAAPPLPTRLARRAGEERFMSTTQAFLRERDAYLLVYSLADLGSIRGELGSVARDAAPLNSAPAAVPASASERQLFHVLRSQTFTRSGSRPVSSARRSEPFLCLSETS